MNGLTRDAFPEVFRSAALPDRETAWEQFLAVYHRLLLKVAASLGGDHDERMDSYTYIVDQLRADDYRRILSFRPGGPARFSTWLVVTARRLAIDHYRGRYGRSPGAPAEANTDRQFRRRLALGEPEPIDLATIADHRPVSLEARIDEDRRSERIAALVGALDPRDQLLIRLRFEDQMTADEIRNLMNFRTSLQVYRRIQQLLRRLRRDMGRNSLFQLDSEG